MNEHRFLLIKKGKTFGFPRKRYFYFERDNLIYFISKSSIKPKGLIKLINFTFTPIESSEKSYKYCIFLQTQSNSTQKSTKLCLYQQTIEENQYILSYLSTIINNSQSKLPKKCSYDESFHTYRDYTKINTSLKNTDDNIRINRSYSDSLPIINKKDSFSISIFNINKIQENELEEHIWLEEELFENDPNELESENYNALMPIRELSQIIEKSSHKTKFQEITEINEEDGFGTTTNSIEKYSLDGLNKNFNCNNYSKKKKISLDIKIPEIKKYSEKIKGIGLKRNSFFQEIYNKEKQITNIFEFPKREDYIKFNYKELNDEKLIEISQQYIWEFQLNNAKIILSEIKNEIEKEFGYIEISLMKIIVSGKQSIIHRVINKVNNLLEKLKEINILSQIRCYEYKGELYLIKGLLLNLLQNKFTAFLALKDSFINYRKLKLLITEMTIFEKNRYLFLSGIFSIGISLIPSQLQKLLELFGFENNKIEGINNLKTCIYEKGIRSNYARLLLILYYVEIDTNFDDSYYLTKVYLTEFSKSPIINWLGSLVSWRFLQGNESIKLIIRSLNNVGGELANEAFYLKFELGWFLMSKCQWERALIWFEEVAIYGLELYDFDEKINKKLMNKISLNFKKLIEKSKKILSNLDNYGEINNTNTNNNNYKGIIMPHRCSLALVISICYININDFESSETWMLMVDYIEKKFNNDGLKSQQDIDISKITERYLKRKEKFLIKYEVLYFLKEVTKLSNSLLNNILKSIDEFFEMKFKNKILENNVFNFKDSDSCIEYSSVLFLKIIIGCLLRNFNDVYCLGNLLSNVIVNNQNNYLIHHGLHWVGRCYLVDYEEKFQSEKLEKAIFFLEKCKKINCEFDLISKTKTLIKVNKLKIFK